MGDEGGGQRAPHGQTSRKSTPGVGVAQLQKTSPEPLAELRQGRGVYPRRIAGRCQLQRGDHHPRELPVIRATCPSKLSITAPVYEATRSDGRSTG